MGESREEQKHFLLSLKHSRAAAFRKEIFPYFRYVAQSGFGLFVSAVLFMLLIGYIRFLDEVPANFPAAEAGALFITAAAVWAPLRTYLRPADPVFLLPMESVVLSEYIRPALAGSMRSGAVRSLAAYLIFVPLYLNVPAAEAVSGALPLWLPGALFAAIGAWNAYGGWRERQSAYPSRRVCLRAGRYAATLASAWALLAGPPLPAIGFGSGLVLLVTVAWRLPVRHRMPWEMLIREESAVMRGWYRFLSWFVDVPGGDSRPAYRKWAAWTADRLPWSRGRAWHYLYAKTFLRSETLGTWLRWHGLVILLLWASGHPWIGWVAYGIGVMAAGLQLTELKSFGLSLSAEALPIRREGSMPAAAAVARAAGIAGTLLLWLFAVLAVEGQAAAWLAPAGLAGGSLWSGWLIPRRISKSREHEEE